jgi:hypothetical protein
MILFWLLWVSLVLGGVAGYLAVKAQRDGLGLRVARVPAQGRRVGRRRDGDSARPRAEQGDFLPVPRVTTRPGSPPGPLA